MEGEGGLDRGCGSGTERVGEVAGGTQAGASGVGSAAGVEQWRAKFGNKEGAPGVNPVALEVLPGEVTAA